MASSLHTSYDKNGKCVSAEWIRDDRKDWSEPDPNGQTIEVVGPGIDAMGRPYTEYSVKIVRTQRIPGAIVQEVMYVHEK
jgi:hypothetical protein